MPGALFAAARAAGRLAELDALCRRAALRAAIEHRVADPLWLFVNVEPEVLDQAPLEALLAIAHGAHGAPGGLRVVLEITERALAARPAELLRMVERIRSAGWRVALDDVGADDMSLAFMPLLRPEVVKFDLRLVQERPGPEIASVVHAVNAYAEASGALLLAEGIETAEHVATARALGARLGQGWFFGRPGAGLAAQLPVGELDLTAVPAGDWSTVSPTCCLPAGTPLRRSAKPLLIEVSKHLEREAVRHGKACVVLSAFQEARFFTEATARRYLDLAVHAGFVAALGDGLPVEPVSGVRGAGLRRGDPVRGEWDVVVLAPHFAAALLARDLGGDGADADRTFEFALTYDRDAVVRAAHAFLSRVVPQVPAAPATPVVAAPGRRTRDGRRVLAPSGRR
jgi:EAL domain-containing protein (putative c-di-GMP-specific phosphodiesterase class I)